MSNLTLDGSTSFIGTEFIKLLATGSSNLATEEYVDDAIEQNGGGGGNVDLTNYYNKSETDGLLNNKLNVNNPQDIIGTLRIDSTDGNGKLIVNAVGAPNDEDFYVNGLSNLGGTLKAQLIQASSNIETSQQIKSNTINTYSNSNMIIQRNAIPYITLDSRIVDSQTVEKIIFMKDVEFSGGLSLNTLSVDTLNTVGLNDMVFNINTLGEMLRLEVGGTVRVPNTRSFISQNIFSDLIQPLTFSNDVVFNGGNSTNDAYEEYVRLDASAEKVSISKETKFENAIQLNQGQSIKWTNVFIREVQGATRPEFDLIVNGSTSHLRLWVNGAIKQAITNTSVAYKVNVDCEQGLTVFTGKELKTNTINSHTNSNLVIQRSGSTYMTFQSNRIDIDQPLHLANSLTIDLADKLTMKPSLESGVNIFDIRNLHPVVDNPMVRFRVGEGGGETIVCEMTNNAVAVSRNLIVGTAYELKTNTINSNGDNAVNFQQNGDTFISLQSSANRVQVNRLLLVEDGGNSIQTHFVNNSNGNYIEFRLGNHINAYIPAVPEDPPDPAIPANGNVLHLNYYSHGNVFLGTNQDTGEDPIPTITINKFSSNTGNAFEVQGDSVFSGTVSTNTLNSETGDLTIQRDGTDVLNIFTYSPTNGPSIIVDAQSDCGISSSWLFANTFANRTGDTDTEFRGAISGGLSSGKVYMKYLHATETLDFDCVIDNTSQNVIGNIINTAVSDKRLKTNIQDIDANYSDCVKNVKLKTFEFKDKKYHNQDKYGMIAQDLLEHLPKEFKGIVRENKPKKDGDKEFLSIDYMKLSVVLWGCLQETLTKVEHLEASMYEMMEDIKELKGKKTTKPKAKAKSKTKVEK